MKTRTVAKCGVGLVVALSFALVACDDASAFGRKVPAPVDTPINVNFGQASVAGSGCALEAAKVEISDNRREILVTFDQYIAELGDASGKMVERKNCAIAIPVTIEESGKRLVVERADIAGVAETKAGIVGKLNLEVFAAGSSGKLAQRDLGSVDTDLLERAVAQVDEQEIGACGVKDQILRANTSITLNQKGAGLLSRVTAEKLTLKLKLVDCTE